MARAKAAATAAAFVALVAVVGAAAFELSREDPMPPATTTTAPSTTVGTTMDDLALAIATSLGDGLDVPLSGAEARCVADGVLASVGPARLQALAETAGTAPDAREQAELVRTVVGCVPADKAAALLGSGPTTTVELELPDEGTDL